MNVNINKIKGNILKMANYSFASHVGAALSVVDILYVLYTKVVDIKLYNIKSIDRDKVILSKGHASTALYSVLAECGFLEQDVLNHYYINGGILPGHLDKDTFPCIDCSAGSLGHGASIGIGMALAKPNHKVFVVLGDGECNEGSVWEAFMLAGKMRVPNLTFIIDYNHLQGFGRSDDIINYEHLCKTLNNWGLDACEIDGHNHKSLEHSLLKYSEQTKVIIAHTIKGNGISFMENELKWHYKSPNKEELALGLKELGL